MLRGRDAYTYYCNKFNMRCKNPCPSLPSAPSALGEVADLNRFFGSFQIRLANNN